MSHYLTVDDLTEYERPVTGPLDTSKKKGLGYRSGYRTSKPLISVALTGNNSYPALTLTLDLANYLTVDDLTEHERPVTGPLDTSKKKKRIKTKNIS